MPLVVQWRDAFLSRWCVKRVCSAVRLNSRSKKTSSIICPNRASPLSVLPQSSDCPHSPRSPPPAETACPTPRPTPCSVPPPAAQLLPVGEDLRPHPRQRVPQHLDLHTVLPLFVSSPPPSPPAPQPSLPLRPHHLHLRQRRPPPPPRPAMYAGVASARLLTAPAPLDRVESLVAVRVRATSRSRRALKRRKWARPHSCRARK